MQQTQTPLKITVQIFNAPQVAKRDSNKDLLTRFQLEELLKAPHKDLDLQISGKRLFFYFHTYNKVLYKMLDRPTYSLKLIVESQALQSACVFDQATFYVCN